MTSAPTPYGGADEHDSGGAAEHERGVAALIGACAVLGGAAWAAACVLHATQPSGCVGDAACSLVEMRQATPATSLLLVVAGVLLVASGAGLLVLIRRHGRLGRVGVLGATLAVAGVALLAAAATVQALFFDGDFALMPAFVVPGIALLAAGLVLVGWSVIRSGVLPRWTGVSLVVGAVLLLGANEQTDAVLLAAPFGLAWMATGVTVWARRRGGRLAGSTAAGTS